MTGDFELSDDMQFEVEGSNHDPKLCLMPFWNPSLDAFRGRRECVSGVLTLPSLTRDLSQTDRG